MVEPILSMNQNLNTIRFGGQYLLYLIYFYFLSDKNSYYGNESSQKILYFYSSTESMNNILLFFYLWIYLTVQIFRINKSKTSETVISFFAVIHVLVNRNITTQIQIRVPHLDPYTAHNVKRTLLFWLIHRYYLTLSFIRYNNVTLLSKQ